jgi:hypothetical protein
LVELKAAEVLVGREEAVEEVGQIGDVLLRGHRFELKLLCVYQFLLLLNRVDVAFRHDVLEVILEFLRKINLLALLVGRQRFNLYRGLSWLLLLYWLADEYFSYLLTLFLDVAFKRFHLFFKGLLLRSELDDLL